MNVDRGPYVTHLLGIEPQDLQTLHRRSPRQGDVALALLEHPAEIDLDALQGLALALVDGQGPCKDERNLVARGVPVRSNDNKTWRERQVLT